MRALELFSVLHFKSRLDKHLPAVKRDVQTLAQALLQYSSAHFLFLGSQESTAVGAGCEAGGGVVVLGWSQKCASLAAPLHGLALTSTLLSWHKHFCFFSNLAIYFQ